MSSTRWVVRSADVKKLIEGQVPQLMIDLEGSTFEQIGTDGKKVGWQMLLAERMNTVDRSVKVDSYYRRIYNVMNDSYQVIDAAFADRLCIALGMNSSVALKTYPKSKAACKEMVEVEYEMAGHKLDKEAVERVVARRFPKIEKELYPTGKVQTPYQVRAKEYDAVKRRRKAG